MCDGERSELMERKGDDNESFKVVPASDKHGPSRDNARGACGTYKRPGQRTKVTSVGYFDIYEVRGFRVVHVCRSELPANDVMRRLNTPDPSFFSPAFLFYAIAFVTNLIAAKFRVLYCTMLPLSSPAGHYAFDYFLPGGRAGGGGKFIALTPAPFAPLLWGGQQIIAPFNYNDKFESSIDAGTTTK
ncbi:hypothetical protein EVAR_26564_1 [Eumeta japonica]|uniref:Uncharacterized protein n=1 Tax=Eumeta variegata TaxID=151549 RepID=A0A4C1W6F8_EUMVA|nr:hypothetical protein EVAR_26564_1 [Eumeta japonica]